ncbi:MAG: nitroreductase family deazaflavin-dependent oxidoreductase [Acidobacteria bacterium]|nr:nitroreductase family deazaflavin-dependent oxidoreductase [Acidobacteriota bacterium]
MPADDYCYVTTTGRRTGQPHRIEIWYAADGPHLYLLSGGGRRSDWVKNILNDPAVTIEIGDKTYRGEARVIVEDAEANRARTLVYEKYAPRSGDELSAWRDSALPIAVNVDP